MATLSKKSERHVAIRFNGNSHDCRTLLTRPHMIRVNDFILYHGSLCEVITVQRNIPRIHSKFGRVFTMFTLRAQDGHIIPADDVTNTVCIYRKNRNKGGQF